MIKPAHLWGLLLMSLLRFLILLQQLLGRDLILRWFDAVFTIFIGFIVFYESRIIPTFQLLKRAFELSSFIVFCSISDYQNNTSIFSFVSFNTLHRNDLWALGCTLYQMLSGTSPFKDASEWLIFQRIIARDLRFPDFFSEPATDLIDRLLVSIVDFACRSPC